MVEVNARRAGSSPDWQSTNLAVFKLEPPLTEKIRRLEAGHKYERQSRQPGDGMLASQDGGLWDEASGLGGRNGAMKQAG